MKQSESNLEGDGTIWYFPSSVEEEDRVWTGDERFQSDIVKTAFDPFDPPFHFMFSHWYHTECTRTGVTHIDC